MRPEDSLPLRLIYFLNAALLAANLIFIAVSVSSNPQNIFQDYRSLENDLQKFPQAVGDTLKGYADAINRSARESVDTIHRTTHDVTKSTEKFASNVTNLDFNAIIRPPSDTHPPVITAPHFSAVTTASTITGTAGTQASSPPVLRPTAPQAVAADLYAPGNCTWWVFLRRMQINDPIPDSWGNAATWAIRAEHDGYIVNHNPSPGAIMQIPNVDYGLGHVAFVESVDPNGTWHISEMNVLGLNIVDHRTRPASAAADFNFIHDKA